MIPPRAWLYGRHYIRKFITGTVAPGGLGKSSLVLTEALALATGRNLLGTAPISAVGVWYWNGEDPPEETERRIAGLCQRFRINPSEFEGRLFVDSGRNMPITIASMQGGKIVIADAAKDQICETINRNNISVLMIDPFVSCHRLPENDNGAMAAAAETWAQIADTSNANVHLVHHVRKPAQGQSELTVDDARGGGALGNAMRVCRVLNRMSEAQALTAKVENRRQFFKSDTGKANLAPADAATWFRLAPVTLPNGDSVAVVESWRLPGALDDVTIEHLRRVRSIVASGEYRKDVRADKWVGQVVADVLGLDAEADKPRIKSILDIWFKSRALVAKSGEDKERKERLFIVPGPWDETDGKDGDDRAPV